MSTRTSADQPTILVYSDDHATREQVRLAIGRRPAPDIPKVEIVECATAPAVLTTMQAGGEAGAVDLAILDGEAVPYGGMGLSRQLKDEIYRCPPILVLIGRRDDAWLATWSLADAVLAHPVDPMSLADVAADLLRRRLGDVPAAS